MLIKLVRALVQRSAAHARWLLVLLAIVIGLAGHFVTNHFRINTDVSSLLSDSLPWRQAEQQLANAFPTQENQLVIVLDGSDSANLDSAAAALADTLIRSGHFHNVQRPDALPFFRQNGLLYLSVEQLQQLTEQLANAQPLLAQLAAQPNLTGFWQTLRLLLQGLEQQAIPLAQVEPTLTQITKVLNASLTQEAARLDWQSLLTGDLGMMQPSRRFIITQPKLDYSQLTPGSAARAEVHHASQTMPELANVRVRMTGSVALNDDEFASVSEGMGWALILSLLLVLGLLWLALRRWQVILAVLTTLLSGLIMTMALALLVVGQLNLISIAFAVMFIGIAVDFGIQFCVRLQSLLQNDQSVVVALRETAKNVAQPLLLAGLTTTAGFLAFTATDYVGVAELGLIAAMGMSVALILNVTMLPALLRILLPKNSLPICESHYGSQLDAWQRRHDRTIVKIGAGLLILAMLGSLFTQFNGDPLTLKNPKLESVATLHELAQDQQTQPYRLEVLMPDASSAAALVDQLKALPAVGRVMWLGSFVPENIEEKKLIIDDLAQLLLPTLTPPASTNNANDSQLLPSISAAAAQLSPQTPVISALAEALNRWANAPPNQLDQLEQNLLGNFPPLLQQLQLLLQPSAVSMADLPEALRQEWVSANGAYRLEISPSVLQPTPSQLRAFVAAVQPLAPGVTGSAAAIVYSGQTITLAFLQASALALLANSLILWLFLRRWREVALTLTPLLLGGLLTLATINVAGIALNHANIIALPLLLGIGVSFGVYYIVAARTQDPAGTPGLLANPLTRGVIFSALTTFVAFGSLLVSSHPGTASMGLLLSLALFYTLTCVLLLLPSLLVLAKVYQRNDVKNQV